MKKTVSVTFEVDTDEYQDVEDTNEGVIDLVWMMFLESQLLSRNSACVLWQCIKVH